MSNKTNNVKTATDYTDGIKVLITECVRKSTALKRFTAFLREYDTFFTTLLNESYNNGTAKHETTADTTTMSFEQTENGYKIVITFKNKDTTDTTTDTTKDTTDTTTDTTKDTTDTNSINNILNSIGNKQLIKIYTDGINDGLQNDDCTITPYENGKELTAPINNMKCLPYVVDYVRNLYDTNVVTRYTYFKVSRTGKRDVILTYNNTHNMR